MEHLTIPRPQRRDRTEVSARSALRQVRPRVWGSILQVSIHNFYAFSPPHRTARRRNPYSCTLLREFQICSMSSSFCPQICYSGGGSESLLFLYLDLTTVRDMKMCKNVEPLEFCYFVCFMSSLQRFPFGILFVCACNSCFNGE